MYVIFGATGNTGKPLTLSLLSEGKKVRILSRDANKAAELVEKGAELLTGDTLDLNFLIDAFKGATAAYILIPMDWTTKNYYQHQVNYSDTIAEAIEKSGVKYVVTLSSVGTHLESGSGVVFGLRYMENRINQIPGINALHLRPTYFMENLFGSLSTIKDMGMIFSPMQGDMPLTMIATKDIGNYAAKRLSALDFSGSGFQYLLGKRDLTYNEVAKVIGNAVGKPETQYVQVSYDEYKKGMLSMGSSESLADAMNEFIAAYNEGKIGSDAIRDESNTTPTSIEDFAQVFSYVYNMNA